jgi:hypothetical protein
MAVTDDDKNLPLHDEAQARANWRGGETIIGNGDAQGLPASEIDPAAEQHKAARTPGVGPGPPD